MDLSLYHFFFFRTQGFHGVFFRPGRFFFLRSRLRSLSFVAFVRWCGDGRFVGLACLCCFHRTRDLSLDRTALSPRGKRRGGGALFQPMRTPSQMRPYAFEIQGRKGRRSEGRGGRIGWAIRTIREEDRGSGYRGASARTGRRGHRGTDRGMWLKIHQIRTIVLRQEGKF